MGDDVALEEKTTAESAPVLVEEKPEEKVVVPVADRVAKIRQELRDGRKRTREAGQPDGKNVRNNAAQHGGELKVLPRTSAKAGNGHQPSRGFDGSAEAQPERVRRANRRLSENNSRANDPVSSTTNANQRTVGRLEASEPIPSRLPELPEAPQPKRGPGRPKKESPEEERDSLFSRGKAKFSEGKPLTKKEVEELREPLIEALKDDFKYLDEALWWYSHDEAEPQIWSDMDSEEIDLIARVLLRRGERSAGAATLVRNVVDASDYINMAVITAPRAIKSIQQLNKRPKKVKKGSPHETAH